MKIISFIIGIALGALGLLWWNYVLLQAHVHYWQCLILSAALAFAAWNFKPLCYISQAVGVVVLLGQAAAWCGFVTLPLAHYIR